MARDVAPAGARRLAAVGEADPGAGLSLDEVDFTGRGYCFADDIPTRFRPGAQVSTALVAAGVVVRPVGSVASDAGQVIASGVRQLTKPRRVRGGRVVRRRVGWQATPSTIVVTTAEQDLAPEGLNRYRPAGPWLIEHRVTYTHRAGLAAKHVGDVPVDTLEDTDPTEPVAQAAGVEEDTWEARLALSLLPRPVRASVLGAVPAPVLFDGGALRYSFDDGSVDRVEVNVLRLALGSAVVAAGVRRPGRGVWSVAQATYVLGLPEVEHA